MTSHSRYDPDLDVIRTDVTGIGAPDRHVVDEIFDELIAVGRSRPRKTWVIACWRDVKIDDPAVATYYGERTAELMQYVAGVVRYAANDPVTRAIVRSETLKHRAQGTRSNLYATFDEALAAVREAEAHAP
jgi:hypothetical protein